MALCLWFCQNNRARVYRGFISQLRKNHLRWVVRAYSLTMLMLVIGVPMKKFSCLLCYFLIELRYRKIVIR